MSEHEHDATRMRDTPPVSLSAAALAAGIGLVLARRAARRAPRRPCMQAAIRKVVGEASVRKGRVKLELPPLVENGNTVPLTVSVESPMTRERPRQGHPRLQREEPAAERGQRARSGRAPARASVSTRIRLADTQTVIGDRRDERRLVLVATAPRSIVTLAPAWRT